MSNAARSPEALRERVKQYQKQMKSAADSGAPTDPTLTGTTTIPVQPDAENPNKLGTPGTNGANTTTPPSDSMITAVTNPAQSGSGSVPSVANGTAADTAATGTLSTATSDKSAAFLNTIKNFKAKSAATHAELTGKQASAAPVAAPVAAQAAQAEVVDMDGALKFASDAFRHVGELICGDAEGRKYVESLLVKQAGEVEALKMLQDASLASDVYARAGAIAAEEQAKQAAEDQQFEQYMASLPPLAQHRIVKLAAIQREDASVIQTPDDLFFYQKGAAAMQQAMDGAEAGAPGAAPGGAEPDMSQMPLPGGDGGMPPVEEIIQVLEMLVQQGAIAPEQAQQIMQEIMAGGEGGEGGAPGGEGGGMPPEAAGGEMPPSEEEKAAALRRYLNLDTIVQVTT